MNPYDEMQVTAFCVDAATAFTKAGQPWNAAAGVWVARMQFDAVTIGYAASRAKHLAELHAALGLPQDFSPAPREYHGNMCGIRVAGLPLVPGCSDPTLLLTWLLPFYVRYDQAHGTNTVDVGLDAYVTKGFVDWLLDWAFARQYAFAPEEFAALCVRVRGKGCRPVPMLSSKDYDPWNAAGTIANIVPVLQPLIDCHAVSRVGYGFELNAFLKVDATQNQLQDVIDAISPLLNPSGIRCYIHLLPRDFSWQQSGFTADFWKLQVGKAAGIFWQSDNTADVATTCDTVNDCLERCAGGDSMPLVLIDGHGVDFIALELTASRQFAGTMTEAEGDAFAAAVRAVPPRTGPAGSAPVWGTGN